MKNMILIVIALTMTSLPALAQDTSDGCGLGWQITQKTSFSATSTRSTTNVFVPPTFGMTSGTLGCARHSLVKKDEAAAIYAIENFDSLRQEMAEGRGENLQALAQLMGCEYEPFARITQSQFRSIATGQGTPIDFFLNVRSTVDHSSLSKSCRG